MPILTLYVSTAIIFLALDVFALKQVLRPLFETHIGDLLLEQPRIGPAVAFYLFYIGGILWFASIPAMSEDLPLKALMNGAILGALAYGTYEITNYATLRPWNLQQVIVDGLWGTFLTAISAWGGVMITRAVNS